MVTSAQDRLAALFKDISLPKSPLADAKTYAEEELDAQMAAQASWKTPDHAQYPSKHTAPAPKPADNLDLLTSSDEDDYVAAFKSKLTMKPADSKKPKPVKRNSGATDQQRTMHAEKLDIHKTIDEELPKVDKGGRPATSHFCSFNLTTKCPYKYMDDANDRVSRHFFANGKVYERQWDLYYLHGPETSMRQPLILVPFEQVESLINEIAKTFNTKIAVPQFPFTLTFFNDGTPEPQFLGSCHSRANVQDMEDSIPVIASGHGEPPAHATEQLQIAYADFKAKFEDAQAATKKTKGATKKKKAADRTVNIQAWCRSLTQVQRYFGLRPTPMEPTAVKESMSWDEQAAFYAKTSGAIDADIGSLDLDKPAPFSFAKSPVLVCIDIESYERGHHLITEVGISTLDTMEIACMNPGENGENWRKQIRSRHFRIRENAHLRNIDFCIGDPEGFQFGESEFVGLEEVGAKIDSCFEWPFSVQYKHDGTLKFERVSRDTMTEQSKPDVPTDSDAVGDANENSTSAEPSLQQLGPKKRNILLVGHGINTDLDYLSKLNSSIFSTAASLSNSAATYPTQKQINLSGLDSQASRGAAGLNAIKAALDTATLYQVLNDDPNPKSLATILYDMDIRAFYLHNGGNDARYTLEALIALAIKARQFDDEKAAAQATETEGIMQAWEGENR